MSQENVEIVQRSIAAYNRRAQGFLDTFEQVGVEPNRFIKSADSVVVPNTAYVRGRDGIETVARSAFIFEVRGGLVAHICLYQEMHEALEAAITIRGEGPSSGEGPSRYEDRGLRRRGLNRVPFLRAALPAVFRAR